MFNVLKCFMLSYINNTHTNLANLEDSQLYSLPRPVTGTLHHISEHSTLLTYQISMLLMCHHNLTLTSPLFTIFAISGFIVVAGDSFNNIFLYESVYLYAHKIMLYTILFFLIVYRQFFRDKARVPGYTSN
jgi:hypothetical protein